VEPHWVLLVDYRAAKVEHRQAIYYTSLFWVKLLQLQVHLYLYPGVYQGCKYICIARWTEDRITRLCKRTMNKLTANQKLMKSTCKNILNLLLPPLAVAQASTSMSLKSFCLCPPCVHSEVHAHPFSTGKKQGVETAEVIHSRGAHNVSDDHFAVCQGLSIFEYGWAES